MAVGHLSNKTVNPQPPTSPYLFPGIKNNIFAYNRMVAGCWLRVVFKR